MLRLKPQPPDWTNESGVKWWALTGAKGGFFPFLTEFPDGDQWYSVIAALGEDRAVVYETRELAALYARIDMMVLAAERYPDEEDSGE